MSRLGQPTAFVNGTPAKHAGSTPREDSLDAAALDSGRKGTAPDFQLAPSSVEEEMALVRAENADLRHRLDQNEQLMHAAVASEEVWLERQKEYEVLLEEKSDVIRSLHQKIRDLQEGSAGENLARADELNRFKKELDSRQTQLDEDENALVNQMRSMEMSLSKDRAELARQRNDLQRLQADIHHEIEMASRDAGLRLRLASLRARSSNGPPRVAPKTEINIELPPLSPPPPVPSATTQQAPPAPPKPKVSSGMFRRIFGGG